MELGIWAPEGKLRRAPSTSSAIETVQARTLWIPETWGCSEEVPRSRAAMAMGPRGSNRSAQALQACCSMTRGLVSCD